MFTGIFNFRELLCIKQIMLYLISVMPCFTYRPGAFSKILEKSLLPLKEVIQPHLPVQLPCYDLVPVISPTLGACVPYGFARRLQVLPTSMT